MRIHFRWAVVATLVTACIAFAGGKGGVDSLRAAMQRPGADLVPASGSLRDPALPASIDIVGSTEGHGGATAGTITVRIGNAVQSSPGVIAPQFEATVGGVRASDMVSVQIEAPGVKFTSILGSYGRLVRLAGADGVLTVDECDALRVSPFSTALEFFVRRELGGAPASDAQHEAAWRAVVSDGQQLSGQPTSVGLEMVTVLLGRLATGEALLPDGYEHGHALLQDRQAVNLFVDQHPEALDAYTASLVALTSTPLSQSDVGKPATALLGPVGDASAPLFGSGAEILESVGPDYRVHAQQSRKNADFSGGLDAQGRLELAPADPILVSDAYLGICPTGGGQVVRRTHLTGHGFRLQRRGVGSDIWMAVADYQVTYPDCPDYLPPSNYQVVSFKSAVDLAAASALFDARHVLGLRSLPFFCVSTPFLFPDPVLEQCEYALHRFDRYGTGMASELGAKVDDGFQPVLATESAPFSWSLPRRGPLQMQYGNIWVRYWTVEPGNGAVRGLVFVAEAADGSDVLSLAGHAPMLDGNVPGGFDTLSPVGKWKYASFEQAIEPYFNSSFWGITRLVRASDGRSTQREEVEGFEQIRRKSTWSLIDGRLYDAYVLADGGYYFTCDEALGAGETSCGPVLTRYFRPLRRDGNRLYGIEELYSNSGGYWMQPPYPIHRLSRATYYEREQPAP